MKESDEDIYLRYVADDNDADLETLLARHRDGLLLFLYGFVKDSEDAEELMLDTFAKLAVDKPGFSPRHPGSFKSWLYAIARRNALMHLRRRKFRTEPLDHEIPSEKDLPETCLLKDEKNRKLYQAMATLKPEYRQALTLLYMDGLSHEEIAQTMGMKLRQIYNLVERGKKSLKKTLEEMGIHDARY